MKPQDELSLFSQSDPSHFSHEISGRFVAANFGNFMMYAAASLRVMSGLPSGNECMVMGQGFHRGFTAAEKTELWGRWKRGESVKAIGRAFGKPSSSIYFLVAPHGGIRPAQRRQSARSIANTRFHMD